MCDYQYLPIKTCPTTQTATCMYDDLVPSGVVAPEWLTYVIFFFLLHLLILWIIFRQSTNDDQYFMPPAAFARLDTPSKMFRKEVPKSNDNAGDDKHSELIGRTRTRFRKPAFYIPFSITDEVPVKPPSQFASSDLLLLKFVTVEQFNEVKELFDNRPIMTKMYISYITKISNEKLKYILPLLSYYYTTGPWRVMWVRFGYDPRKDFESRYYQQMDYRARLLVGKWNNVSTKSQPVVRSRASRKTAKEKKTIDSPYFDSDRLPKTLQCIYQVYVLSVVFRLNVFVNNTY